MISNEEYKEFKKIALKMCSSDERTEDLIHDVLIQLSTNEKFNSLTGKTRTFFFIRSIQNQFYSNNSYFHRNYRRQTTELPYNLSDIPDEEYYDTPSIEWVREELEKELESNPDFWYDKGVFELYLTHKKLDKIHKQTQIPKYSLRDTILSTKKWLIKKWQDGKVG